MRRTGLPRSFSKLSIDARFSSAVNEREAIGTFSPFVGDVDPEEIRRISGFRLRICMCMLDFGKYKKSHFAESAVNLNQTM